MNDDIRDTNYHRVDSIILPQLNDIFYELKSCVLAKRLFYTIGGVWFLIDLLSKVF